VAGAAVFSTLLYALADSQAQILALSLQLSLALGWLSNRGASSSTKLPFQSQSVRSVLPSAQNYRTARLADASVNLQAMVDMSDELARDCVLARFAGLDEEIHRLASGRVVFENTETWRTMYEKVLCAPGMAEYRSVSWTKTADYWQDRPGQQSIRLNYDLLDRGVEIQRIVILGWNLWSPELALPSPAIRRWLEEQHFRGIAVSLVRESDLVNELDLLRDFGIYGVRATGEQELDEQSRTVKFELRFDEPGIRLATDRWERLKLYARPFTELLDREGIGE